MTLKCQFVKITTLKKKQPKINKQFKWFTKYLFLFRSLEILFVHAGTQKLQWNNGYGQKSEIGELPNIIQIMQERDSIYINQI